MEITTELQYQTKAQTFIAKRGALVMKEFASIGTLTGLYRSKIEIDALTFSIMQAGQLEQTYGLRVTVNTTSDGYTREGACLVDQDEIPELISGLRYLKEKLDQMAAGVPNYTEIAYTTKDNLKIGFFVNPGANPDPTVFCSAAGSENAFMETRRLLHITEVIEDGLNYLRSTSAVAES